MWLLLDAGNSSIKSGVYRDGRVHEITRFAASTDDERKEAAARLIQSARTSGIERIGIASVVPGFTEQLEKVAGGAGIRTTTVSHSLKLPFKSAYETPLTMGADRVSAVAGAVSRYRLEKSDDYLILVLAGTAITIEVVDGSDTYLGGLIMPGPDLSRHALRSRTAQLPEVPLDLPADVIGVSTTESIQCGVLYGMIEAVGGLVNRIAQNRGTRIILCGGWADLLHDHLTQRTNVDQSLILMGTAVLLEMND